jgi:hypothetical protein
MRKAIWLNVVTKSGFGIWQSNVLPAIIEMTSTQLQGQEKLIWYVSYKFLTVVDEVSVVLWSDNLWSDTYIHASV